MRIERAVEAALSAPLPAPMMTAADVIAARAWSSKEAARPPLTPEEVQAALSLLERAAEQEQVRSLPKRVPIEGGSGASGGRGGTGTSTGGTGRPGGATGPAFGDAVVPHPAKTATEGFLRWLLEPGRYPEPQVHLHPRQKLAAVNAALSRMQLPDQRQRLQELQAWYYFQARALQAQDL